jgi:hypothetical protein
MRADLFEHHDAEWTSCVGDIGQEALEAEKHHAGAFEAARLELAHAGSDAARAGQDRPAAARAEIEREDRARRKHGDAGRRWRLCRFSNSNGQHGSSRFC